MELDNTKWSLRGILVGLNLEKFIVQGVVHDNFFLKFKLKNKIDSFEWTLITVYGAAQEEEKESFLQELVQACSIERIPLMVPGGGGGISIQSRATRKKQRQIQ
jgi:hypothetical protein